MDPDYPVAEWDRLLDQAFLTLNLLRTARINPSLSAHTYLFGNFDFNSTPLAPLGTRVVIHSKPNYRASWDANGKDGWYIGYSPHHYRCMKCYMPKTRSEINADTIVFFPHIIDFPIVSTDTFLKQAALDIITLLTNPPKAFPPSLQAGDETKNAILQLAIILGRNTLPNQQMNQQNNLTLQKAKSLPTCPIKHATANNTVTSSIPSISKLQSTLARLVTRVQKSKNPQKPILPPSNPSFKHRAAKALITTNAFNCLLKQQSFPIFNHKNEQLTLQEAITNPDSSPKAYHIFDAEGKKANSR